MSEAPVQLVVAAQNGDREAFGRLVEHYRGRVYAMAMAITADTHEAQELTQETFVRALKNLPRLEAPDRFQPWLRGITHTIGRDIRRKAARERRHLEAAAHERSGAVEAADAGITATEAGDKDRARLAAAVSALPEQQRIALDLRFREGLAYAQIGEVLGVPASTVRGLLFRGTKTLRETLAGRDGATRAGGAA